MPDVVLKNLSWSIGLIILLIEIIGSIFYLKVKDHLRPTSHLIVGIIIFLIINEISMLVAESYVLNTSYLVLFFILSLSIVNIFGNISLG